MHARPGPNKGFTLIEVMLATAMMVAVIHASMVLTRACNYRAVKARIDGQIASLMRYEVERTLHMPYSNLATLASVGGASSSGFLYKPLVSGTYISLYPYTITTTMSRTNVNTANENVVLSTSVEWQEPPADYATPGLTTKTLSTGTRTRRRF